MINVSNAESKVVTYLQKGWSNQHIAEALNICEKTVKFHLTNIFKKYDVKSRAELIAQLNGYTTKSEDEIMSQLTKIDEKKPILSQAEKIQFIDTQFKVGEAITHLHKMMMDVTAQDINPATVNAACNCVARLNETINTAISAAKFLNER